mgnify:CR=1 FL=1
MPLVIPSLYLVKTLLPRNSISKLRKFQYNKLVFMNTLLLTSLISNFNFNDKINTKTEPILTY